MSDSSSRSFSVSGSSIGNGSSRVSVRLML